MGNKVKIFIGATNSGKSSIVRNTFLTGKDFTDRVNSISYTYNDDNIILGRYDTNTRRVGTDTINRRNLGLLKDTVLKLYNDNPTKDIVLEGVRCISRPLMNFLLDNNVDVELYWVFSDAFVCFARAVSKEGNQGNPPDFAYVLGDITKSANFFNEYKSKVNCFKIITTDENDFSAITLSNCTYDISQKEEYEELW